MLAGARVWPAEKDHATGEVTSGAAVTHTVMLSGIYADSPARAKLMYTVASFISYFSCPFCRMIGTSVDSVVRFLGYHEPVRVDRGADEGKEYKMGVEDQQRWYTRLLLMFNATRAEQIYRTGEHVCTLAASHMLQVLSLILQL